MKKLKDELTWLKHQELQDDLINPLINGDWFLAYFQKKTHNETLDF